MKEKDWSAQVRDLARTYGWRVFHHPYSLGVIGVGFPDLVLVRERVVFAELKGPRGKLSPLQKEWIGALLKAKAEVHVWKPDDWDEVCEVLKWDKY